MSLMTLITISFRNLFRQRRRNILLGVAMAFGVMVMTISFSFSRGLSDNLLNKIIRYVAGHVKISFVEQGRYMLPIIRDRAHVEQIISQNIIGVRHVDEVITAFGRVLGNGKADVAMVVGISLEAGKEETKEFLDFFSIKEGRFEDLITPKVTNPIAICEQKAKDLHVRLGEQIRIRVSNVNGQTQTAIMTVAVIMKSQNMIMDFAMFTPMSDLKRIMGYQPYETGALQLTLDHPQTASKKADQLHRLLASEPAYIEGQIHSADVIVVPIQSGASMNRWVSISPGFDSDKVKGAVLGAELATKLKLKAGGKLIVSYQPKFESQLVQWELPIEQIVTPSLLAPNMILLKKEDFFAFYNYHLPQNDAPLKVSHDVLSTIQSKWILLKRSQTTTEATKRMQEIARNRSRQPVVDVASMYETASMVIKMESVLNGVTLLVSAILFFIIMIGVLNALRMTIIERTREIGTLRAIGMRKSMIRWVFMLEVLGLTFLSWCVGTLTAFIVMIGLSLIPFAPDNPLNMLMVHHHLYFIPSVLICLKTLGLILLFALATVILPARKASNLRPADALRHYN